jgi:hypothetical protein
MADRSDLEGVIDSDLRVWLAVLGMTSGFAIEVEWFLPED